MSTISRTPIAIAETARRLARHRALWQPRVDFDPVTRYYARLAAEPDHEAWLLTWLPGQGTPWHDHGGSSGSFVILQGVLTEEVAGYRAAADLDDVRRASGPAVTLSPGDQRTFGRRHLHRVTNIGPDPAVSLHVYAPRLTVMTNYEEVEGVLEAAENARAGVDW
ncbi:cysteine dioxygenase [Intrasporangium oryzae NRRL B-24470]|uniref:Cysteine dioxygenase n=1 Tax=Intrasporangium oryzae NRRL B-24470 TaxID=1386089 RepID=W9G8V4_9MICO|nr:cysteine dioxygenase family protein [Intrasporangium oryzae]EWT02480.1 cysteine dioxygenase [Intrasporangium oryzae NRRL B-24470]